LEESRDAQEQYTVRQPQVNTSSPLRTLAVARDVPGLYNIVDADPAEVSVWLPELARVLGAKPPLRLPAWVGRVRAR
jgi:hypothetical protein